jgi:hypothetical protein
MPEGGVEEDGEGERASGEARRTSGASDAGGRERKKAECAFECAFERDETLARTLGTLDARRRDDMRAPRRSP